MTDTRTKYVPASIDATAFNCPHCGALAKQFWHSGHADSLEKDRTPLCLSEADLETTTLEHIEDKAERKKLKAWAERVATGAPFMERNNNYRTYDVQNLSISKCFNCNEVAIWIHNRLVWPVAGTAPLPNPDLPAEVRRDYEEAGTIINLSPRGAAALLRLAIQKLCKELGEKGRHIDTDIASLVAKGLDVRVQQALDVVRVIGNNAVHPGQIDLRDDHPTAEKLFGLVNIITEVMISQPKHIADMYASLPESALKAIEKRDNEP